MGIGRWECNVTKRRINLVSDSEFEQRLDSILDLLQIGNAPSGLANSALGLVQESSDLDTERLHQGGNFV